MLSIAVIPAQHAVSWQHVREERSNGSLLSVSSKPESAGSILGLRGTYQCPAVVARELWAGQARSPAMEVHVHPPHNRPRPHGHITSAIL